MIFENENAFRDLATKEKLNLFLGAGFSVHALNRDSLPLMLGFDLKTYLIRHFELNKFQTASLPQIASHLKRTRKGDFYYLMQQIYKVKQFDPRYRSIIRLPIANIFTTNIDDLCEDIYKESADADKFLNDVEIYGFVESPGVSLFKLHGSVTYTHDKEMFFSSSELSGAFLRDPGFWNIVAMKIASHPTLFWGVNLDSPNIVDLVNPATIRGRPSQPKWLVVLPDNEHDLLAEEYSDQGFRIIRSTSDELLTYFAEMWKETEIISPQPSVFSRLFVHNYVPAVLERSHPVRPLAHFYQGADPTWSDIISGNLVKISHYDKALEHILNSGNTLITGSPGCGKTTMLMQLAASPEIPGTKFYFTDIQITQANFLAQKISQEDHVTVFLDNVSDSVDSYLLLASLPNLTLVTAERDVKYETVRHLLNIGDKHIFDISDLSDQDIQKIADSMSRPTARFPAGRISLFEISYQLWAGRELGKRIKEVIKQIEKVDYKLLEFYTLLTYVRYTGIYASMDMLYYYYGDEPTVDYNTIYNWVDTIYSMIDDFGYPEDLLQDYFTLRSAIFSDLSLEYLPPEVLETVIVKFHKMVHRGVIHRFDIFRRKAYDADITVRAFPDAPDGIEFYRFLIQNDPSPFIRHQFALYLWRKGKPTEAWEQIDIAYTQTGGNVFSISNTHAFILFGINISKKPDADGIVLKTLHQTFSVLDKCLTLDMRKSYHVMTYANNAIRYFKKFQDDKGIYYLECAKQHLTDELSKVDYHPARILRDLIHCKKQIEDLLK